MRVSPRASAAYAGGTPALPGTQTYPYKPIKGDWDPPSAIRSCFGAFDRAASASLRYLHRITRPEPEKPRDER